MNYRGRGNVVVTEISQQRFVRTFVVDGDEACFVGSTKVGVSLLSCLLTEIVVLL